MHERRRAVGTATIARLLHAAPPADAGSGPPARRRLHLAGDVVVVVDCYNATPMTVTAALDDLASSASGRRVAVLGDLDGLGPDARRLHAEIGAHARQAGVEQLVVVGDLSRHAGTGFAAGVEWAPDADRAATLLPSLVQPGDTVLLAGPAALERVADALQAAGPAGTGPTHPREA